MEDDVPVNGCCVVVGGGGEKSEEDERRKKMNLRVVLSFRSCLKVLGGFLSFLSVHTIFC